MFFRPFDKTLGDLTTEDLKDLEKRKVPEGIALEYKRDWVPDKIARAVAAMANNVGGTLVVGMETRDLIPTDLCGFETGGDPAEMVVQVIRDHISPIPDYRPLSLGLETGRKCLVVEVDQGSEPPYLLTRTGQIVIRTPTSSAPASREEVQGLFNRGQRGREWAQAQLTPLQPPMTVDGEVHLTSVPSVYQGLSLNPRLFRRSVVERVDKLVPTPFGGSAYDTNWNLKPDRVEVSVVATSINKFSTSVSVTGVVRTEWRPANQLPDFATVEALLREGLPKHSRILQDVFGFHGSVFVALGGHIAMGPDQIDHYHPWIYRGPLASSALQDEALYEELRREVRRTIDLPDFEPE